MDTENVQTTNEQDDVVSEKGTAPDEVQETPEQEVKEALPLTEERVLQLITERESTAEEKGRQRGRAEMQSEKDINVRDAIRRANILQRENTQLGAKLKEFDPDAAELARLQGVEQGYLGDLQKQQSEQQTLIARQTWYEGMGQSVTEMGIDVNDKRIDWAFDAPNADTAQRRILASTGKILNEDRNSEAAKLRQELKDEMQQFRKDQGLDSHDTTTSAGVVGSDAEFVKKFGAGEVPLTQANVDRYNKITSSY